MKTHTSSINQNSHHLSSHRIFNKNLFHCESTHRTHFVDPEESVQEWKNTCSKDDMNNILWSSDTIYNALDTWDWMELKEPQILSWCGLKQTMINGAQWNANTANIKIANLHPISHAPLAYIKGNLVVLFQHWNKIQFP